MSSPVASSASADATSFPLLTFYVRSVSSLMLTTDSTRPQDRRRGPGREMGREGLPERVARRRGLAAAFRRCVGWRWRDPWCEDADRLVVSEKDPIEGQVNDMRGEPFKRCGCRGPDGK